MEKKLSILIVSLVISLSQSVYSQSNNCYSSNIIFTNRNMDEICNRYIDSSIYLISKRFIKSKDSFYTKNIIVVRTVERDDLNVIIFTIYPLFQLQKQLNNKDIFGFIIKDNYYIIFTTKSNYYKRNDSVLNPNVFTNITLLNKTKKTNPILFHFPEIQLEFKNGKLISHSSSICEIDVNLKLY